MNKVAIIILNWNSKDVTIDCLISLLKIQYSNFKIYLVDNGSIDESIITFKRNFNTDKIRYIVLDENYGFTGGNNIGITLAKEEYNPDFFLLLNNDTIVDPSFLMHLTEPFKTDKNIGIVVPKIYFHDPSDHIYYAGGYINLLSGLGEHNFWRQIDKPILTNVAKEVSFANGCSMLIKKEVIESVGLLDDLFFANIEDVDYSFRTAKKGFKIFYNPNAFLWHREGYSSKKNIGNWFRVYLSTRNIILFQRKRTNIFSFILFFIYFSLRWIMYMEFKSFLQKDYKSCKAIFWGVLDGFSKKLRYINRPITVNFSIQ